MGKMGPLIELIEFLWRASNIKYLRERNFRLDTTRIHCLLHHLSVICLIFLGFMISSKHFPLGAQDNNILILFFKKEGVSFCRRKKPLRSTLIALSWGRYLPSRAVSFPKEMTCLIGLIKTRLCSHHYGPRCSDVV